jgi:predicted nuclease of restriction endonuclease-like (RecB) superfamily
MNKPTTDLSNFNSILSLIKNAKERIVKIVNTEIIDLYWQIGKEVSKKTKNGGWGKSVVEELTNQIAANFGNMRGFSPQNIWRMKQFYETYKESQILSTLSRELSSEEPHIIDATLLCSSVEYTWTNKLLVTLTILVKWRKNG